MKKMAANQQGITFLGLVFVLGFIAIVVLFVLRAFPLYNEKFQVVAAMKSVVSRPDAAKMSTKDAHKYFMRNIQVTNINRFTDTNIKEYVKIIKPKKKKQPRELHVSYQATNKLFSDLQLMLLFDEKMPMTGNADGG